MTDLDKLYLKSYYQGESGDEDKCVQMSWKFN